MVYLLCFDKKYKHAKHYIGFTETAEGLEKRMERHRKGQGARLIEVITKAGIGFELARTWPDGDRNFERKLKNRKKSSDLCPLCKMIAHFEFTKATELKRREQVLENEKRIIEEMNTPPLIEDSYADHERNPRLILRQPIFNFDKVYNSIRYYLRRILTNLGGLK